ncbi:hypothetical protein [Sphingomonas sp. KR3-1]|uniref:hypothetical protein n=1 Tax=Sphingomonas sp. KR3-1 TaxID=3156611 RepID=UPI0032B37E75
MFKIVASALFLSLAWTLPAAAQGAAAEEVSSAGDVPDHGNPEAAARAWAEAKRNAPEQVRQNCWNLGCMVIVNQTSDYDVIGFYVDSAKPGKHPFWSGNQFGEPLPPERATLRFKTGNAETCALPVRFVLRQRDTHAKVDVTGTASFCSSPHQDTLVRINAPDGPQGKVYVRGDDEAPPLPQTH